MNSTHLNAAEAPSDTNSREQARQPGEVEGLNSATVHPFAIQLIPFADWQQ